MATLYIVSTPIGNLQDISLRALQVLSQVDVILCEDTRKTKFLLEKHGLLSRDKAVQLWSFYEQNEDKRIAKVITALNNGQEVALVSNAGTPLLSDPGFKLVRSCCRQKINVSSVPGPSALLAALVVAGLPMDKFMFLGFLPKKSAKREKLLQSAWQAKELITQTIVFYESPFRIVKTLQVLQRLAPEAEVVIARELSKKFEQVLRGKAAGLLAQIEAKGIKGELVVMVH